MEMYTSQGYAVLLCWINWRVDWSFFALSALCASFTGDCDFMRRNQTQNLFWQMSRSSFYVITTGLSFKGHTHDSVLELEQDGKCDCNEFSSRVLVSVPILHMEIQIVGFRLCFEVLDHIILSFQFPKLISIQAECQPFSRIFLSFSRPGLWAMSVLHTLTESSRQSHELFRAQSYSI